VTRFHFATLLVVLVAAGLVAATALGGRTGVRSGSVAKTAFSGRSSHERALNLDEVKLGLRAAGIRHILAVTFYKQGPTRDHHYVMALSGPPLGANYVALLIFPTVSVPADWIGATDVRACNVMLQLSLLPLGQPDSARDARAAEQAQQRIASQLRHRCAS
jgi:hypothetical protein